MSQASSTSSDFNAGIITPPLSVSAFMPSGTETPGNVAVCLSGGGSRAMSAGMGQLLALETITAGSDSASLLSQTKVLSTVSGGSWIGVPFTYLPSGTSDTDFLGGPYVAPSALTTTGLGTLPTGCVATGITSGFSLTDLAATAYIFYKLGAPPNMLWQILMGSTFLQPYGLYELNGLSFVPDVYFTFDESTASTIQSANKGNSLASQTPAMVASVTGQTRPYHVCNMAMAVTVGTNSLLAPVQGTPFFTGIVSSPPNATDANSRLVGGGGVTSFAFDSSPASVDAPSVSVQQAGPWTLTDIIGTSSAAFAELLISGFSTFAESPPRFAAALRSSRGAVTRRLTRMGFAKAKIDSVIDAQIKTATSGDLAAHRAATSFSPTELIPAYQYWPITAAQGGEAVNTSSFADAGSLDNTGIASALAYTDVGNVISFVNTEVPISKDDNGNIVVDGAIPPLFGFQPYDATQGYVPYSKPLVDPSNAPFQNNQIFASDQFSALLEGLWAASGSGTYQNSPIFTQTLTTQANAWFGVAGGTTINVLWAYLEIAEAWAGELPSDASNDVASIEAGLVSSNNFPHYSTLDTELDQTQINLLANLTAWTVMTNQSTFTAMYTAASQAR